MKATLLDCMGTDLTVVNAARVSFGKRSKELIEQDIKLINYLAAHNHWTPFGHPQLSFHIEAPIFVARQLAKHQVGGVWNEVSRRYVDSEPEMLLPLWRERIEKLKQGSGKELPIGVQLNIHREYKDHMERTKNLYRILLSYGVCPEQARMVLPLSTYTEWHWTGSLVFFARVCKLRLQPDTQQETRELVQQIANLIEPLFPHSWKALNG
jgi:thymidylate synthase (FAD)